MKKKENIKYLLLHETTEEAILHDALTYGFLLGSFFFNQEFMGGNNWVDAILFVLFWIVVFGSVTKRLDKSRMTFAEFYKRFPKEPKQ